MNVARELTAAYDAVLASHDLLLMPTTPMKAQPLPAPGAPREEVVERAMEMTTNTAPVDVTHHPAMAIPCGMSDGLPISMMLVGKHFDEPTIYRAAYAYEQPSTGRDGRDAGRCEVSEAQMKKGIKELVAEAGWRSKP
jgi:amidase